MVVSLLYLLFRRVLAVAALRVHSREFKELEIVVLRDGRRGLFPRSPSRGRFLRERLGAP
jgi:hypothetical protein